jgi:hypothetical protein
MSAIKRFQAANFFRPPVFFALVTFAALEVLCADANSVAIGTPVAATNVVVYAPAILPGNGLAQHPFLYTGEWDNPDPVRLLPSNCPTNPASRRMATCSGK